MAHEPRKEDYQRLSLRYMSTLDEEDDASATRRFSTFSRTFAQDRDSLPQSDADRAFHLVVLATNIIDYQLPFATEEKVPELKAQAKRQLEEAVSLDSECHDAVRMLLATNAPTVDAHYQALASRVEDVRISCESARDKARETFEDEREELACNVAMRPYWRWLACMAELALICGRNHDAIAACEKALESDPHDMSDVRFTLALALAKLEDDKGFEDLRRRYASISPMCGPDDAWMLLASTALAYKRCDLTSAREALRHIVDLYPHAALTLIRQGELPDGEFARIHVSPYSEDELILATSESIVLFQEGNDRTGRGVFGAWVAREMASAYPKAAKEALRERQAREGDNRA